MLRVLFVLSLAVASLACTVNSDCGSADDTQPGLCVAGVCQCGAGYSGNTLIAPASCTQTCTPSTLPDAFTNLNIPAVSVSAAAGNFVLGVNIDTWLYEKPSTVTLLNPVLGTPCNLMTGQIGSWEQQILDSAGSCNSSSVFRAPFATQVGQPCVQALADTTAGDAQFQVTFQNFQTRVQIQQSGQGPLATGQKRQFLAPIAQTFQRDYTISIGTTFTVSSQTFGVLAANIVTPTGPTAVADARTTPENAALSINWLQNDVLGTYQLATLSSTQPAHGTVTALNLADGTFLYTPATNYHGADSFTYTVCDNGQPSAAYCASFPNVTSCTTPAAPLCSTATVSITVSPTGPTANPDAAACPANGNVNINVLANDVTPITPVTVTISNQPATGGSAAVNGDNTVTFTAAANYAGDVTFTYQVCDPSNPTNNCATATVTVTVSSTAPVAQDDTATVQRDSSNNLINVLSNDAAGSSPLNAASLQILAGPANGAASISNGQISYTPTAAYHGGDALSYQICDTRTPAPQCVTAQVSITVVGQGPTAVADTFSTPYLGTLNGLNLLANDAAVAPRALVASSVTLQNVPAASQGTLTGSNGVYSFTAASGFSGAFVFSYTVSDDSNPALSASATVTINVAAPLAPLVTNDAATTNENSAVTIAVLSNDQAQDGSSLTTPTIASQPTLAGATVTVSGTDIIYTPPNFVIGTDSFTYSICDTKGLCSVGTVTVTIIGVPPVANNDVASTASATPVLINVLANDVFPLGAGSFGLIRINGAVTGGSTSFQGTGLSTQINFTPNAGFAGAASFQYDICDITTPTQQCSTATVTINVAATNPIAAPVSKTIPENSPTTSISASLSAGTGGPINLASLAVVTAASHGTAVANTDGTFSYTPNTGFYGSDSFTYLACDNQATPLCSAPATVSITVTPVGPTALADTATTSYRTAVSIPVTANDIQGAQPFTIQAIGTSADGTLSQSGNNIVFTPGASYSGTTTFSYTICDDSTSNSGPLPLCSSAQVSVTVQAATAPTANADAATTPEETAVAISVLANDQSGSSAFGALTSTSSPAHGTLSLAGNVFTYTPTGFYYGADSFNYQICNAEDLCSTATVSITVTPRGPQAVNDAALATENSNVVVFPLANDIEGAVPKASWTYSIISATGGSAQLSAGTSITFTPTANSLAAGSVVYEVCDVSTPTQLCSQATIDIAVQGTGPTVPGVSVHVPENSAATAIPVLGGATAGTAAINQQTTITGAAAHGTATANANGSISYQPATGYWGNDQVTFQTCDISTPTPQCTSSILSIIVDPLGPTANPDATNTAFETPVTFDVVANDQQGAQPFATPAITLLSPPAGASVAADGRSITFAPATGFTGSVTINYRLSDTSNPSALTSDSTFTVIVDGIGPQVTAILYRLVSLNYDLAANVIRATVQTRTPATAKVNAVRLNSGNSSGLAPLSGAPTTGPACAGTSPSGSCDQFHTVTFQSTPCSVSNAKLALDADFTCSNGAAASTCGYINFKATYLLSNMNVAYDACSQTTTFGVDTAASSLTLHQDAGRTTQYAAGAGIEQLSTIFCRATVAPSAGSVFSQVTMTTLAVVNAAGPTTTVANAIGAAYFAGVTPALTATNPAGNALIDFDLLLDPTVFLEANSYFLRATFSLNFANTGTKRTIILPINGLKTLRSLNKGVRDVTAPAPTQQAGINSKDWAIPRAAGTTAPAVSTPSQNSSSSSAVGIGVGVAVGVAVLIVAIIVIVVVLRRRRRSDAPHRLQSDAPLVINQPSSKDDFN